jgi:hypothetical protein
MKPRLRRCGPVGQRILQEALIQYICSCSQCRQFTAFDPILASFVSGRICGRKEYELHQQLEAQLHPSFVISATSPSSSSSSFDTSASPAQSIAARTAKLHDSLFKPLPESQDPSTPSPRQQVRHERSTKVRSVQDKHDIHQLEEIEKECSLRSKELSAVQWHQVIFTSPPEIDSNAPSPPSYLARGVNEGPYALEFQRSENARVLKYEAWLMNTLTDVDAILSLSRPHVQEKRKKVAIQLNDEIHRVDTLRKAEWHKRHDELDQARKLRQRGIMEVIDTSNVKLFNFLDNLLK